MINLNPAMHLRQKALETRQQSTVLFQLGHNLLKQGKQEEARKVRLSAIAKSHESTRLVREAWELEQNFAVL